MQKAIEYEIERQIEAHESGEGVSQETRLWDEKNNRTRVMRSKEDAHDYRYFPEPDLQPLKVSAGFIAKISIFESAMAPMVTGVIIATEYNLNPKLSNIILSIGIPVSLGTTFLWTLVLQFL